MDVAMTGSSNSQNDRKMATRSDTQRRFLEFPIVLGKVLQDTELSTYLTWKEIQRSFYSKVLIL